MKERICNEKKISKNHALIHFSHFDRLFGFISGNICRTDIYRKVISLHSDKLANNYLNKYICWYSVVFHQAYFYSGSIVYKCVSEAYGSYFQVDDAIKVKTFIIDASEIAMLLSNLSKLLVFFSLNKYLIRPRFFFRLSQTGYDLNNITKVLNTIGVPLVYVAFVSCFAYLQGKRR